MLSPYDDAVGGLLALTLIAYALLGGADYGGGVWDLFATGPRKREQRALIASAIGPVWEVNHVWLILAVVILFTGFPPGFAALSVGLHVPLTLLALGIVFRGAAFTFRTYDTQRTAVQRRWGQLFSIASMVSPVLLGMTVGTLASGSIAVVLVEGVPLVAGTWWTLFNLLVGLLALGLFAFLAAAYLAAEAESVPLRRDFSRRARSALGVSSLLALATLLCARTAAPRVWSQLTDGGLARLLRGAAVLCSLTAAFALGSRKPRLARALAVLDVSLILLGWVASQRPYLFAGSLTLTQAHAEEQTQKLLLGALAAGSVVLVPSLVLFFRVFKFSGRSVDTHG